MLDQFRNDSADIIEDIEDQELSLGFLVDEMDSLLQEVKDPNIAHALTQLLMNIVENLALEDD